jgi:NAD dependent epimerase/dehydratase family enzyme
LPIPGFALRAVLGEMSELVTTSQRVLPKVAQRTGYEFEHAEIEAALTALLEPRGARQD